MDCGDKHVHSVFEEFTEVGCLQFALLGFLIERLLGPLELLPEMLGHMNESALGAVEVSTSHGGTRLGGTADGWH